MDSFRNQQQQQQGHMPIGPPMGPGADHWFPSSSPPPPPPPSAYYSHQYPHHPPPQHWGPSPEHHHHHPPIGVHPPPPYHHQPSPYSLPPPPSTHHHQYPHPPSLPPRPQPPMPHHHLPPPSAFPPPTNQTWGNPSWTQHQGWEYPERIRPYNNEEDWAARAKAWATATSVPENHHAQSQFARVGRMDEQSYSYLDRYPQAVGAPDLQQPSFPRSSSQQSEISTLDLPKQVNNLHGASFSSGSSSFGTGYSAGDETIATNTGLTASPQKNYGTISSMYEQEVSYSYSSAPGHREIVHRTEGSYAPPPLPSSTILEGNQAQATLPMQMISAEQPCFSHRGQPTELQPENCDQPLEFEVRHDLEQERHPKMNYAHGGPPGAVGLRDHNPTPASIHAWTPSTAPGVAFPQISLGAASTQFDPVFVPQAPLPVHPSTVFGGIPPSSFQHSLPPVSTPFGLGPGASLHTATFPGDSNGSLNLTERPKKAAVPNWLREEIIKKKSAIPSTVLAQPTGNSHGSVGEDDVVKSFKVDQSDSKSVDSTRSTEDEEEDEEDVEAARSAAINQEIKRVLTEVLLKVTDELFDEIATKVLNEDDPTLGVEESTIIENQKSSPTPSISAPKASAKVLIPVKTEFKKANGAGENSNTSSPGGNVLGLANYSSDDDGGDDIESSKFPSSGKKETVSQQEVHGDRPSINDVKGEKNGAFTEGITQKHRAQLIEENSMTGNGLASVDNLHYPDKVSEGGFAAAEESIPAKCTKFIDIVAESELSSQSIIDAKHDKRKESLGGHSSSDKSHASSYRDKESRRETGIDKYPRYRADNKTMEKATSDSMIHDDRNKSKEKMEKSEKLKDKSDDRSSGRGSHVKEFNSRSSKNSSFNDDRKETKKEREKIKEDGERRKERVRENKEDRSARVAKDSSKYSSRRSPSPRGRGKSSKDNSFSYGSASGDERSDNSKKRRQRSFNSSLSPSPTKPSKRRDSRSPHSKHSSHRRHSPYSSSDRSRKRSRSISPVRRRSASHKRDL